MVIFTKATNCRCRCCCHWGWCHVPLLGKIEIEHFYKIKYFDAETNDY